MLVSMWGCLIWAGKNSNDDIWLLFMSFITKYKEIYKKLMIQVNCGRRQGKEII